MSVLPSSSSASPPPGHAPVDAFLPGGSPALIVLSHARAQALTQGLFFRRVRGFLRSHSLHPGLQAALADPEAVDALWAPHWPQCAPASAHDAAVRLTVVLACRVLRRPTAPLLAPDDQGRFAEAACKQFLARRGLVRFSAFDAPQWCGPPQVPGR